MRVRKEGLTAWILLGVLMGSVLGLRAQENPLWDQGLQLFQKKDYAGAAAVFEQVIAENPAHPAGYYMLALCQINLNKMADAEKNLQKVIELEPKHFGAYYYLAYAAMQRKQYKAVVQYVDQGLPNAIKPEDKALVPGALKLRGAAHLALGSVDKAAADLQQALQAQPNDDALLYLNGLVALRRKQAAEAYQYLNRAYTLRPNNRDYARYLIEAANLTQNYARAREVGEALVAHGGASPEVLGQLGIAYLALQDYSKAASIFKQLPDSNPTRLYNLAQAYIGLKDWPNAEATLQQWRQAQPQNPKVYELLGYVYENQKRFKDALDQYKKAYELSKDDRYQDMIKRATQALQQQQAPKPNSSTRSSR
ncbi:Beta-barrel assembly-enhancing protease [bacterium HR11]|nr:Beta-barrel assembly-enhancing protease [bacterium HR11]